MAYTLACTSSTVRIAAPGQATSGTLSGVANLAVTDTSTGRVVATPSVTASGSISENDTRVTAGSNGGWNLYVTWARTGSASGTASGTYSGTGLTTGVPVAVDHGGKPHQKKGEEKGAGKGAKKA